MNPSELKRLNAIVMNHCVSDLNKEFNANMMAERLGIEPEIKYINACSQANAIIKGIFNDRSN